MKKTGYENLDVRAADAVIIKRYTQRCGVKIVDAVHSIARLLDHAKDKGDEMVQIDRYLAERANVGKPAAVLFDTNL